MNFGSDYYSNVDHAEVLEDGYTVKVYMKTPQVNMLTKAGYWVDIMPEHLLRDVEDFATCEYPTIGYGTSNLKSTPRANTSPSRRSRAGASRSDWKAPTWRR